jgi:hypothetical protein
MGVPIRRTSEANQHAVSQNISGLFRIRPSSVSPTTGAPFTLLRVSGLKSCEDTSTDPSSYVSAIHARGRRPALPHKEPLFSVHILKIADVSIRFFSNLRRLLPVVITNLYE